MDYKNSEVHLTIQLEGALATSGKYQSLTKVDENNKPMAQIERNPLTQVMEKSDIIRIKTIQLPRYHKCEQHTTLNGAFCAHAVSDDARPKKTIGAPYWNRLSPKNRLEVGIAQYIFDVHGDAEYSFQVLGE